MKHCSFFCVGIWPFLILPLLMLAVLLFFMQESIEHQVALNAKQALATSHAWAKPETHERGRDVLLTGIAPSQEALSKAKALTLRTDGVRVVGFAGEISAPVVPQTIPAKLQIEFTNNQVVLSGKVSDQATIDEIMAAANLKYGAERVVNQIRTGSTKEALAWSKLIGALEGLNQGASASISGEKITLNGSVNSQSIRDTIEADLQIAFNGMLENKLVVKTTLKVDQCIDLLAALLSETKISFDSGKIHIKESSNPLLQKIADTAKRCPDAVFEVAGHTDSSGEVEMNMGLSQLRAEAVIEHLANLGLNPARFRAKGYGPVRAIADNSTASGRAANRRIEFNIRK